MPQLIESTRKSVESEPLTFEVGAGDVFANEMVKVCKCDQGVHICMQFLVSIRDLAVAAYLSVQDGPHAELNVKNAV